MTSTEETLAGGSPEGDPPKEAEENELQELPRKDQTPAQGQQQEKQQEQPQSPGREQPQQQDREQKQPDQQQQEQKEQDQEKQQQDQEQKQQDQDKKQQDQPTKQQDPEKKKEQEKKRNPETHQQEKRQQPQQDQQQKQKGQQQQQQQQPGGETNVAKAPPRKNRNTPFIPPTVEALGGISQMVVKSIHCSSQKGGKYQVLGENKSVLFQVRRDWEPNECKCFKFLKRVPLLACCNRNTQPMKFFLRDLMMQDTLVTEVNFDSRMCCFNSWTADVTLRPDVKMGSISNDGASWRRLVLTNPAGDRLLTVKKEQRFCDMPNYTIFSLEGAQVGEITTEMSKTRMKLTKEVDMKWKVLLLCFAIVVQHEQEQRESKSQQQNPY